MSSLRLGLCLVFGLIFSVPLEEHLVVHGQIQSIPPEYIVNGAAGPQHLLQLTIELNPGNVSGLEAELYAVSDPRSSKYGQHLTKGEVDSFVCPSSEATTALNNWLASHGVEPESTSSSGHLLTIQIPVEKANLMFNASFMSITHTPSNRTVVRALEYSLPSRLSNHTRSVRPILAASSVSSSRKRTVTPHTGLHRRDNEIDNDPGQGCDKGITLGCIQKTYNIPSDVATQGPVGTIGILSLNGEQLNATDIAKYLKIVRPNINLAPVQVEVVVTDSITTDDGLALTAQIETFLGINHTQRSRAQVETPVEEAEEVLSILNLILAEDDVPDIITTSYFTTEDSADATFVKTAKSVCDAITQFGVRGSTVLALSGDGGDTPSFPSTCPHVTSVGSTRSSGTVEVAVGTSGGGFSNIYARPPYQDDAVTSYLNKIPVQFNSKNRNMLQAPQIWAAIIAYLNTQRQNEGKSPLGFLNPLLYANPSMFSNISDITQGSNAFPPEPESPVVLFPPKVMLISTLFTAIPLAISFVSATPAPVSYLLQPAAFVLIFALFLLRHANTGRTSTVIVLPLKNRVDLFP
ncbi:hypothetical protein Clacol_007740 [Clathrus columnatus]|uniref:Peptidase S53 domain-containing protein n=1 Tax=Clathrus columnatus TaxID=1419009 RepID=A0AAV5AFR6_9AGAM|nr:hypothetical protein Clacol_007740 [Clathrus columnatus]